VRRLSAHRAEVLYWLIVGGATIASRIADVPLTWVLLGLAGLYALAFVIAAVRGRLKM
jgi:hypothetical protein